MEILLTILLVLPADIVDDPEPVVVVHTDDPCTLDNCVSIAKQSCAVFEMIPTEINFEPTPTEEEPFCHGKCGTGENDPGFAVFGFDACQGGGDLPDEPKE